MCKRASLLEPHPFETNIHIFGQNVSSLIITSFCDESLVFCAQWVAFFPLDVLLPHFYLLGFLGGVLGGY